MEILEQNQQQQQIRLKATWVLCKNNKGQLTNVRNCGTCTRFCGLTQYPNGEVPKLLCGTKLLDLYTQCDKTHEGCIKVKKNCSKCIHYRKVDVKSGKVGCAKPVLKHYPTNRSIPVTLPNINPQINFPFSYTCPKTQSPCSTHQCVKCPLCRGLTQTLKTRMICSYNKIQTEYLTFDKVRKRKTSIRKTKIPRLKELFQTKTGKPKYRHLRVCCPMGERSLFKCITCIHHIKINDNTVYCRMYGSKAIVLGCKCSKSNIIVPLVTCLSCTYFFRFTKKNDEVVCGYSKLTQYITKPARTSEISRLTHRKKFYYDIPD